MRRPKQSNRLFGAIPCGSPKWQELYTKRQAIEKVFKSLKYPRGLDRPRLLPLYGTATQGPFLTKDNSDRGGNGASCPPCRSEYSWTLRRNRVRS